MNTDAARGLAMRFVNLWPHGAPIEEWIDVLNPLDEGTAGTALARLRNEHKHAPSIAAFIGTYRSLHTATSDPPHQDTCPLERCSGDGWNNHDYIIESRPYRGVTPCGCPAGRLHESAYNRVVDHPKPSSLNRPTPIRPPATVLKQAASMRRHPSTPELFDHESETL